MNLNQNICVNLDVIVIFINIQMNYLQDKEDT